MIDTTKWFQGDSNLKKRTNKIWRKFVLTLVQMSRIPSKTIRALMLRILVRAIITLVTTEIGCSCGNWTAIGVHPDIKDVDAVFAYETSGTQRTIYRATFAEYNWKSSERPVFRSPRESVFLSITTRAVSYREERRQ